MLYCDGNDLSEGFVTTISNKIKECMMYPNGCHGLTMLSVNICDIAIITIKNVDYRSIIHKISKSEASNLLENSVLEGRRYI